jgi:precorrin-6Y C5,15-methyltransferase (decarboxylating)
VLSAGRVRSADQQTLTLTKLTAELRETGKGHTAVLVSGDTGFCSLAKTLVRDFSGLYQMELIPGISSIQYLSAKIRMPYDDAKLLSLHGKTGNIVAQAAYNPKLFVLTGGANNVRQICLDLYNHGLENVELVVGERLSYPDEQITGGKVRQLKGLDFDELSVLYIENLYAVDPALPLNDEDFIRSEVPMTKQEVRWVSVQKLAVQSKDVIYDIGAGSGSVSVELARKATNGFVYAFEKKAEACELIRANRSKHGAFNIDVIHGEVPDAMDGLPAPDKVFIGGSSGNLDSILEKLVALNPQVRVVANAVTIQSLGQIVEGFEKYGLADADIVCMNVARAKKVGRYDMMIAQNPVYIVSAGANASANASASSDVDAKGSANAATATARRSKRRPK